MTVAVQTTFTASVASGASTVFPYGFKIAHEDDLTVTLDGVEQTTGYSVTNVGDASGGDVVFDVAPTAGVKVVRYLNPILKRETDYQQFGDLMASVVNLDFDRQWLAMQMLAQNTSRSLKLPIDTTTNQEITEDAATRANKGFKFDGSGNLTLSLFDPDNAQTDSEAAAAAAAASADAASVSASNAAGSATAAADSATDSEGFATVAASAATAAAESAASVDVAAYTHAAAGKATPVDADEIPLADSAAAFGLKKLTWANLKATLKTYFDTLYAAISVSASPPIRQTVLSGPVDSSGFAAFGGSTGGTVVTAAGTLKATAAAGGDANRTGSITNPSWTGLSTNGTMHLYLDIAADGTCTPGSTTLEPTYRWGGADVTTNGQNTYNIQEATMKVGNGSAATQVYRVFVGRVTVAGGVVTAITWYQLNGKYRSAYAATLPSAATLTSFNHLIGVVPDFIDVKAKCLTTDAGYAVGDVINPFTQASSGDVPFIPSATATAASFTTGSTAAFRVMNKTTGAVALLTAANWSYQLVAERGW